MKEHGAECIPCSSNFSMILELKFFQHKLQIYSNIFFQIILLLVLSVWILFQVKQLCHFHFCTPALSPTPTPSTHHPPAQREHLRPSIAALMSPALQIQDRPEAATITQCLTVTTLCKISTVELQWLEHLWDHEN